MNLWKLTNKLQKAFAQEGRQVRINQFQMYSERAGRMVTKYVVQEPMVGEDGARRLVTHIETYKQAEVVKKLVELYEGRDGIDAERAGVL